MLCFREGQPLKLPETKKTLQFTFNGEQFASAEDALYKSWIRLIHFATILIFLDPYNAFQWADD